MKTNKSNKFFKNFIILVEDIVIEIIIRAG